MEARTCALVQNVVIRGAGWLETENEKDPDAVSCAECSVTFPREGKYEVFITYAAAESWPVNAGANTVEFYREHPIPHIQRIRFRPSS